MTPSATSQDVPYDIVPPQRGPLVPDTGLWALLVALVLITAILSRIKLKHRKPRLPQLLAQLTKELQTAEAGYIAQHVSGISRLLRRAAGYYFSEDLTTKTSEELRTILSHQELTQTPKKKTTELQLITLLITLEDLAYRGNEHNGFNLSEVKLSLQQTLEALLNEKGDS
jgi:hypothetical protein